jgi:hypothetical protein
MRFYVAPIAIWIFELPLDQETRAVRVIRILLGLEHGLVVVTIAEDRSRDIVGVNVHDSPQLHIRFKKAYRDPGRFETASPRFRHGTHAADSTWLSWGRPEALAEPAVRRDPKLPLVTTAANGRDGEGFRSFADIGADGEVAPTPAIQCTATNRLHVALKPTFYHTHVAQHRYVLFGS